LGIFTVRKIKGQFWIGGEGAGTEGNRFLIREGEAEGGFGVFGKRAGPEAAGEAKVDGLCGLAQLFALVFREVVEEGNDPFRGLDVGVEVAVDSVSEGRAAPVAMVDLGEGDKLRRVIVAFDEDHAGFGDEEATDAVAPFGDVLDVWGRAGGSRRASAYRGIPGVVPFGAGIGVNVGDEKLLEPHVA
jgi:hypothetical protein